MKRIVGAFSLVLLCSLSVYSQNNKIIYDEYGPIYTSMNDSIIVYNTKEGKQLEVKLNQVSFKDGDDYLKEYLKRIGINPIIMTIIAIEFISFFYSTPI